VTLDATAVLAKAGPGAGVRWEQMRLPDRYAGAEYYSGNPLKLEEADKPRLTFTADYPGRYRLQLAISGSKPGETTIDITIPPAKTPWELRGVALDMWHYTDALAGQMAPGLLASAAADGANLVMFSPTFYQSSKSSTTMAPCVTDPPDPKICRGAMSDAKLVEMIRLAKALGMKTIVKPILNIAGKTGPEWPDLQPSDWDAWFRSWTAVLVNYARLCEKEKVDYLALGNELRSTGEQEVRWRTLIAEVRRSYAGLLTYGDNSFGYEGWGMFPAMDALDAIGVHLWGPLSGIHGIPSSKRPGVDEMATALDSQIKAHLDPVAAKYGKPVFILEFGTGSYDGTNQGHWDYDGPLDNGEQAEFYEAGFRVFASRPYIRNVTIWAYTWETRHGTASPSMNPLKKPAEEVVKLWFGGR
jgi:hypothetical protein